MQPQLRSIVPSQHGRVLSASPMRCKRSQSWTQRAPSLRLTGLVRSTLCPERPCWKVFYSSPSEGGEQGDAMMPLLFCLGQHAALEAIQRGLNPNEKLFAFFDDLYLVSKPDRVGALYNLAQRELWAHCRMSRAAKHTCGTGVVPSQKHVITRVVRI